MLSKLIARLPRIPSPEYADVVWAAQEKNAARLPESVVALLHLVGLFCIPATIILTYSGWVKTALALWFVASICDWSASRQDSNISRILSHASLGPSIRALVRSLTAAFPFTILAYSYYYPSGVVQLGYYLVVVLVVQLAWAALIVVVNLLSQSAPILKFQTDSQAQNPTFLSYARIYKTAVKVPIALQLSEGIFLYIALIYSAELSDLAEIVAPSHIEFYLNSTWFLAAVPSCLIAIGWALWIYLRTKSLRRSAKTEQEALVAELAKNAPDYVFYVSMGFGLAGYMANQWLPVFDQVDESGFIIVREASQLLPLSHSKLPVYYAATPRQVETLTLPGVKAAFYSSYSDKNGHLMSNPRLKHVMILHGDSDKAASTNALARSYDEIWVAGEAGIERYWKAGINIPREHFVIVGRPQAGGLKAGPLNQQPKIVLYAPTFEGYYEETNYTSLGKMGAELVKWLLTNRHDVRVWFKPHPSTGRFNRNLLSAKAEVEAMLRVAGNGNLAVDDHNLTINECLDSADLLITDVSSVMTDFLYTGRPSVVCNPRGYSAAEFEAKYPSLTSAYRLDTGLTNIAGCFEAALGADPKASERELAKTHLLGDLPGGPQQAFSDALTRLVS